MPFTASMKTLALRGGLPRPEGLWFSAGRFRLPLAGAMVVALEQPLLTPPSSWAATRIPPNPSIENVLAKCERYT